jgi:hypothetical protein
MATHLSLNKDAPVPRGVESAGNIICRPILLAGYEAIPIGTEERCERPDFSRLAGPSDGSELV